MVPWDRVRPWLPLPYADRDNFYSVLPKLKLLVEAANMGTRQGVQTLVANGMSCERANDTKCGRMID